MEEIKDLVSEDDVLEQDGVEQEGAEQEEKRIIKPAIPIDISENVRLVLASDRKNIMVQTKTDGKSKEVSEDEEEDAGWKTKGYYGTSNWNGVLNKLCAMYKDEKFTKMEKANIETVGKLVKEETSLINVWCKKIIATLQDNNINI
jgi:hypothetical protein